MTTGKTILSALVTAVSLTAWMLTIIYLAWEKQMTWRSLIPLGGIVAATIIYLCAKWAGLTEFPK